MNKEIEDALHTLLHCSLKDTEYETQFEQYKIVRDYIINLQQENKQLKEELEKKNKKYWQQQCAYYSSILYSLEEWLQSIIYEIEPMGCSINYNCEYDSEEDYINAMKEQSKLNTLKLIKDKIQELKEKYK